MYLTAHITCRYALSILLIGFPIFQLVTVRHENRDSLSILLIGFCRCGLGRSRASPLHFQFFLLDSGPSPAEDEYYEEEAFNSSYWIHYW